MIRIRPHPFVVRTLPLILVGFVWFHFGCSSDSASPDGDISFGFRGKADLQVGMGEVTGRPDDANVHDEDYLSNVDLEPGPDLKVDPLDSSPDSSPDSLCIPDCTAKECGDDGCGGFCAACPEAAPLCVNYKCTVQCIPDCTDNECGGDGCGGLCGVCPPEAPDCIDNKCTSPCQPDCAGKECGDDGCGEECGQCPLAAPLCEEGLCKVECLPDCANKNCGWDGCGGECGQCTPELPVCTEGLCGPDPDSCTEAGKQVFLVTESKMLLRFEPKTLNLVTIGVLNCNAQWGETPYSMSVDRNSFAWVLYSDGTLWKVNTEDASCQATNFQPNQLGFEIFGMGFSTDGPDTQEETLYIAGGSLWDMMYGDATLGSVDSDTLTVSTVAPFAAGSGLPELTGNRSGELWGFFPKTSPPRIAQINKNSAGLLQSVLLPANMFSDVQAWAFAYWGGDFYIFFKSSMASASGIWRVSPGSGQVTTEMANTGYVITGAGVSTCAPTGDGG
jgi:hypothetical protein